MHPPRAFLPAAFALALMSVTMAVPACAHANPTAFVNCIEDSGKGAALINAVNDILDGDNRTQVLEQLAIAVGPDVLKCVLEQVAAKKAAGPSTGQRSLRAREYLDAHGGGAAQLPARHETVAGICPWGQCAPSAPWAIFKKGGGEKSAMRVGALPHGGPRALTARAETPGTDDPGVRSFYG